MSAAPAQAAESASSCFRFDTGAAYANQPVQLYRANGAYVKCGMTASNGCAVFTGLTPTWSYRARAYTQLGNSSIGWRIYEGWTPYQTGFGYGRVSLGTGVSYYQGCIQSIYGTCWSAAVPLGRRQGRDIVSGAAARVADPLPADRPGTAGW